MDKGGSVWKFSRKPSVMIVVTTGSPSDSHADLRQERDLKKASSSSCSLPCGAHGNRGNPWSRGGDRRASEKEEADYRKHPLALKWREGFG